MEVVNSENERMDIIYEVLITSMVPIIAYVIN